MTYRLIREQRVGKPLAETFAFFERPENLATLTPPSLHFLLLSPSPVPMAKGARIDYRLQLGGFRVRWTSTITEYDPPHGFTDEQTKGPYAFWRHRHAFSATADGTLVRDEITYGLPWGFLGRIAHALYVRAQLNGIFDYREKMLRELLG